MLPITFDWLTVLFLFYSMLFIFFFVFFSVMHMGLWVGCCCFVSLYIVVCLFGWFLLNDCGVSAPNVYMLYMFTEISTHKRTPMHNIRLARMKSEKANAQNTRKKHQSNRITTTVETTAAVAVITAAPAPAPIQMRTNFYMYLKYHDRDRMCRESKSIVLMSVYFIYVYKMFYLLVC